MPKVALIVETALGSGRQILRGISRYVHEKNNWEVFHYTGSLGALMPEVLDNWDGDGIIARIHNEKVLQVIGDKGLPTVDVLGNFPDSSFPRVMCDNREIARLVAEQFESRGFHHYGYLGLEGEVWSNEREKAFQKLALCKEGSFSSLGISHSMKQSSSWETYLQYLKNWLNRLPKPVGIFICSDQFAPDLIAACALTRFKIPEDIAVVGVDNDPAFCEVVRPSLSSVRPNHCQVGYLAACLLADLMKGKQDVPKLTRVSPFTIEERQSTDVFAVREDGLKKALFEIKARACNGVSVDEIASTAGYSRSVLQRRFKNEIGRSVHDMIVQVRLNRAKELLTLTALPIVEIALASGFNHQEYLGTVFKRHTGYSPAQYRKLFNKI